jgi:hypothetical protein
MIINKKVPLPLAIGRGGDADTLPKLPAEVIRIAISAGIRDGGDARAIGKEMTGDVHSGVRAQWIDADTLAWCEGEPGALSTTLCNIGPGEWRLAIYFSSPKISHWKAIRQSYAIGTFACPFPAG